MLFPQVDSDSVRRLLGLLLQLLQSILRLAFSVGPLSCPYENMLLHSSIPDLIWGMGIKTRGC